MKKLDMKSFQYTAVPLFVSSPLTAHSGPELIIATPNPSAAMDLASALMNDNTSIESPYSELSTALGLAGHISLTRR